MNKTKSKVLSLVLASAMIVSSFSSLNFASAATSTRENGRLTVDTDELYLASNSENDGLVTIDDLLGSPVVKTYDNEEASDVEFVSFTHASGDRIVKSVKDNTKNDNDIDDAVYLSKDAKGKEVITVTYEGEYDRDDKTVKVRGKKDITVYADPVGAQVVGKPGYDKAAGADRPDAVEAASINDAAVTFSVYTVGESGNMDSTYTVVKGTESPEFEVKTASDKAFAAEKKDKFKANDDGVYTIATKYHPEGSSNAEAIAAAQAALKTAKDEQTALLAQKAATAEELATAAQDVVDAKADVKAAEDEETALKAQTDPVATAEELATAAQKVTDAKAAQKAAEDKEIALKEQKPATDAEKKAAADKVDAADKALKAAEVKGGALKYASTGTISTQATLNTKKDSDKKETYKFSVAKQWTVNYDGLEINKKGSSTYISENGDKVDFDSDKWSSDEKSKVISITGYDVKLADGINSLDVNGGKVGNIVGGDTSKVTVDGATTGDIKANVIDIDDGNVGTLKVKGDKTVVTMDEGKVKAIDAKKATVTINGGTVSGDVVGATVDIDADDDEIATTINGNVTAKDATEPKVIIASSSDAAVKITGTVKGAVELSDENVTVNVVDADYENDLSFDDFSGTVASIINTADVNIDVLGASAVTVKGTLDAGSINIEDEDGKLTIGGGTINSVSGDGTLAVPAGKLFIEDSLEDVTLQLTEGLTNGATAFQAYSDAVDVDDFNTLGYTVEQKAANSDVDKFVINAVTFAGVQFDKSELSIAKGYEGKVTVAAYPTATTLPAGASIQWDIDANDDYITMTTEGNTATVKVVDFNTDYATDNQATVTATVVDANGNAYDGYVAATAKITATAVPQSAVTLDTTKPVTVNKNGIYQYIAKSSTGAVLTAASSDAQIADVKLFNAADARGYKFEITGKSAGTATITTTDANGASATLTVNVTAATGTLKADTTSVTFAPGAIYDVKFSTTGTNAVPVVSAAGNVVSIAPRGNGVYRVTAKNPGTAWVVAKVGDTRVTVTFNVKAGVNRTGVVGNNVSNLK